MSNGSRPIRASASDASVGLPFVAPDQWPTLESGEASDGRFVDREPAEFDISLSGGGDFDPVDGGRWVRLAMPKCTMP